MRQAGNQRQGNHYPGASADDRRAELQVALARPPEHAVEPAVEPCSGPRPAVLGLGLQQQRGEGRAQGKRVECRERHRDGDGHRELLVKPASDAGDEYRRHKHRRQDQRQRHDRAGHFVHRFHGRILWAQALLNVPFRGLDDDDRVVHHQPDGQHQPEQGQGVDRKAEEGEEGKGADERDGHGQQRNERRAPALQKDEHHDADQDQGNHRGCARFRGCLRDTARVVSSETT